MLEAIARSLVDHLKDNLNVECRTVPPSLVTPLSKYSYWKIILLGTGSCVIQLFQDRVVVSPGYDEYEVSYDDPDMLTQIMDLCTKSMESRTT